MSASKKARAAMANRSRFILFPQLPLELRLAIWRHYVVSISRNRTVILNESTKRVHPTVHLISPALSVNFECREVAKTLSKRLLVFPVPKSDGENARALVKVEKRQELCRGAVYVNLQQDTIVLGANPEDWLHTKTSPKELDITRRHFTTALTQEDTAQMQYIMECRLIGDRFIGDRKCQCLGRPYCIYDSAVSRLNHEYDRDAFPAVRSCQHLLLFSRDLSQTLPSDLCRLPGDKLLHDPFWTAAIQRCDEEELTRQIGQSWTLDDYNAWHVWAREPMWLQDLHDYDHDDDDEVDAAEAMFQMLRW